MPSPAARRAIFSKCAAAGVGMLRCVRIPLVLLRVQLFVVTTACPRPPDAILSNLSIHRRARAWHHHDTEHSIMRHEGVAFASQMNTCNTPLQRDAATESIRLSNIAS
jgi:hypothetical protein